MQMIEYVCSDAVRRLDKVGSGLIERRVTSRQGVGSMTLTAHPNALTGTLRTRRGSIIANIAIALVIIVAIVAAFLAIWGMDITGKQGNKLGGEFTLNSTREIADHLMQWQEVSPIDSAIKSPRSLAAAGGKIYVGGDDMIGIYAEDGREIDTWKIDGKAVALDVGEDGSVYVATPGGVIILAADGESVKAKWDAPEAKSVFVSIALAGNRLFVTDYGRREVLIYDLHGKLLRTIDGKSDGQGGFNLPSPYFYTATGNDGLVRVVNTGATGRGAKRIEAYTVEGERKFAWGKEGEDIEGFCGCCNPVAIAFLPNGEVVTAEKTMPTIKVFSPDRDGAIVSVVAGPKQFGKSLAEDLAVDSKGRILALVLKTSRIRVFQRKIQVSNENSN